MKIRTSFLDQHRDVVAKIVCNHDHSLMIEMKFSYVQCIINTCINFYAHDRVIGSGLDKVEILTNNPKSDQ